jgi:hypothetical protein
MSIVKTIVHIEHFGVAFSSNKNATLLVTGKTHHIVMLQGFEHQLRY